MALKGRSGSFVVKVRGQFPKGRAVENANLISFDRLKGWEEQANWFFPST